MEGRTSMAEAVIKPVFFKAGLPLVLSVAGFVCARLIRRRCTIAVNSSMECKVSSLETNLDSKEEIKNEASNCLDSQLSTNKDDEKDLVTSCHLPNPTESSNDEDKSIPEEEIMSLKGRIEKIENRESHLGSLVLQYHVMKEKEYAMIELENMLLLETTRLEFLGREISLMEAEKQRFDNLVLESLKVVKRFVFVKLENGLLRKKVKKFLRRTKQQTHVIRVKNFKIEAVESELLSCRQEVDSKASVIKKLEDEARGLQDLVNHMREEKKELLAKLNSAESTALSISKIETGVKMEDYNELANEVDQLRKDRAAEVTELTRLRETDAFLRHELMRTQKQLQHQIDKKKYRLEPEQEGNGSPDGDRFPEKQSHDGSESDHKRVALSGKVTGTFHCAPKRKNMLRKIKRWMEGGESLKSKLDLEKRNKDGTRRLKGVPFLVDEEDVHVIPARTSF